MNLLTADLCSLSPHSLHIIAKIVDKDLELLKLLPIRYIVDPVHKGQIQPVKMLCNGLIGCQHKVLNDVCSHIPLIGLDLQGMSFLIQQDLALRKVKTYGSPLLPPLS